MAASIASVPLAANQEYFRSPGVISAINLASTPRSGSINSWLGMGVRCELCLHRLDHFGMTPTQIHHAKAAEAINDTRGPAHPERSHLSRPFDGSPIAGFGYRLAILQPAAVEMLGKIILGFFDDPLALLLRGTFLLDDLQPLIDE